MRPVQIVVPCFNEARRLAAAEFLRFVGDVADVGFVFIDDGSTDDTASVLRRLCHSAPAAMRLVTLARNAGKGEAVRCGMRAVLADPGVRYAGYWDADLAAPLVSIRSFVDVCEAWPELELVMGSRAGRRGGGAHAAFRRCVGRLFAATAAARLGLPVRDTQCGAKLFRASETTRRLFDEPFHARWVFDVEILARIASRQPPDDPAALALRVREVPVPRWREMPGSKRRMLDYVRAARDLWWIGRRYARRGGTMSGAATSVATASDPHRASVA